MNPQTEHARQPSCHGMQFSIAKVVYFSRKKQKTRRKNTFIK
ncbi:hypothetical protein HMPREF0971_00930 [Segatella oris F0302]|uniref:Uncharacterized protein n=1 Tax=Segatella oris F0302 TaxID=649760 RepID=D1QPN7_9BACT|nr:hypothetical protein HMPREF0971_00930 [Segatella oris F0302]